MKSCTNRILSILLCVCLCFCMCSCQMLEQIMSSQKENSGMYEDVSLGYTKIDEVVFEYSQHYKPFKNRESYNSLDKDSMRLLYDKLYEYVHYVYPQQNEEGEYKTKQVILDDIVIAEPDIRLTIKALCDDNPQIFWLTESFGFLRDEKQNYTAVQLFSRLSPQGLSTAVSKLKDSVNSFYSTLRSGLSQAELELLIHDYILAICEYDKSIQVDENGFPLTKTDAFDAYGALVDKKAVCEGYARAFELLCNGVGIKCINIIGQSQGELHMWNAVELDNEYYFVDTTWDDGKDKALMYDYFNITTEQLKHDHDFSKLASEMTVEEICGKGKLNALTSNFYIPQCNSTKHNYYVNNSPVLSSFNDSQVTQALLEAAQNKEEYFHFRISADTYNYDYAVDQLFYSQPQYFFKYTSVVNNSLEDYSIDVNNMSIFQKEHLSVVTVVLNYV